MILVFSANSNASPQIKREIERSVNKGVTVVPFRIDDILPSKNLGVLYQHPTLAGCLHAPLEKHLDSLVSILGRSSTNRRESGCTPAEVSPPEEDEDEAPVRPARRWRRRSNHHLEGPQMESPVVLCGVLIGAVCAGACLRLVYKGRPPRRLQKRNWRTRWNFCRRSRQGYYQKGKNAQDVDEKIALFTKAIELNPKPGYYYIQRAGLI